MYKRICDFVTVNWEQLLCVTLFDVILRHLETANISSDIEELQINLDNWPHRSSSNDYAKWLNTKFKETDTAWRVKDAHVCCNKSKIWALKIFLRPAGLPELAGMDAPIHEDLCKESEGAGI